MTREEAIGFGNTWLEINEDCKNSSTYEFFQMAIKALELEQGVGKWIVEEESAYPCRGHLLCECDKCGHKTSANYHDLAWGDKPKYIMPQFCEKCGNKKSNTVIYPTK